MKLQGDFKLFQRLSRQMLLAWTGYDNDFQKVTYAVLLSFLPP